MFKRFNNWFEHKSIRDKVNIVVLGAVHLTMFITFVGFAFIMQRMAKDFLGMMSNLGVTMEQQLEDEIIDQNERALASLCQAQATTVNERLAKLGDVLGESVHAVSSFYSGNASFTTRGVVAAEDSVDGEMAFKYTLAPGVSQDSVQEELAILSNAETVFTSKLSSNSEIRKIYIGTDSGIFLDCSNLRGNIEYDPRVRSWYQTAMEHPDTVIWTDPYVAADGETTVITVAEAYRDAEGNLSGVIGVDIAVKNMIEDIIVNGTGLSSGEGSHAFLLNSDFEFTTYEGMASTTDTDVDASSHFGDWDAVKEPLETSDSGVVRTEFDGSTVYLSYATLNETGWTYCITLDEEAMLAPVEDAQRSAEDSVREYQSLWQRSAYMIIFIMIVVYLIGGVAATMCSFKLARRISEPIARFAEGIRKIGKGDFDQYLEIDSDDELGEVADRFNHMQINLMEYMEDLKSVTAEKERIGAELNVATEIQANMLPNIFPAYPDRKEFDLFASMDPAKEVGGDFYDFFMVDGDHLALIIADVSGKGVPAALFMVISKTLLKNASLGMGSSVAPEDIFTMVNDQLCEGNEAGLFVTVWMGILQLSTGEVRAASAGHEYPARREPGGQFELINDPHGFVLGGMEGLPFTGYTFTLKPGSTLFVYTDGVAEATNANDELYGTDRMLEALNQDPDLDPKDLLPAVRKDVDKFVGAAPQFDDLTMLGLKYCGPEGNVDGR